MKRVTQAAAKSDGHICALRRAARRKSALQNIVDERTMQQKQKQEDATRRDSEAAEKALDNVPRALHRFYKKTVL